VVNSINTKWLSFNSNRAVNLSGEASVKHQQQERGIIMKKVIVALACALLVPLAFAQTSSKSKKEGTATTSEGITVTGTIITDTEEGSAANYQPLKTFVIREDGSTKPGRYEISGPGHVVNKAGNAVTTSVKPGTRVRVYFTGTGNARTIDHVVVVD